MNSLVMKLETDVSHAENQTLRLTSLICTGGDFGGTDTFGALLQRQCEIKPSILTGYIEVNQPFIFAHFILSRTLVHDGRTGVADLKPAHYL